MFKIFKTIKKDWQKCSGVILLMFTIIALFIVILIIQAEINKYNEEHPCLEYKTTERHWTSNDCVGGIMLPGYCITQKREHIREEKVCVGRK